MTAYPLARSMTPIEGGANGHTAQRLVETSRNSWGETNLKSLTGGQPAKLDDDDKKGPVSLAAAVSAPATATPPPTPADQKDGDNPKPAETRVVAFGDSDFASNGALGVSGQPRSVPEHDQLARAAGEPDRHPAARSRRSAHHADGRPTSGGSST